MGMFTVMCNMEGRCKAHKRLTGTEIFPTARIVVVNREELLFYEWIPYKNDMISASSGANVKHKDLKAHEKGDKNGKSDARTSERTDISCTHGPGAEGDPVGVLLGAENLPMVGAAGVLVLPRRQAEKAPEKVPEKSRKKAQVDFTDLVALLADEELDGWGGAEEPAWQLFERRKEQQNFHRRQRAERSYA
ncbi:unnamed protein product [Cladocopium goreaui]|uniref:Uncharacterized protein n=1 Tax=Cladocopium goreaui TaxID=2562237 RepID=A0A9P1DJ84_9DINO|nr:unnamed protein product [Cladocopium goreaui]